MYWRLDPEETPRRSEPEEITTPRDLVQRTLQRVFSDLRRPDEQAWLRDIDRRHGNRREDFL